jgi:O-antigen/teichoic acid export membrane protein
MAGGRSSTLGGQITRLARHSAIYGLGGLASRLLAVFLLPLYTHYLSPADYGRIETLVAASAVLTIVLRMGISSAFFRFYFDAPDEERRVVVVRTSFWFTMVMATAGLILGFLLADQIARLLHLGDHANLVRAAAVGLWSQMNYEQLTSLFRVEERSVAFVIATLVNLLVTVGATLVLVVALDQGPVGVLVGGFTGTLFVYAALLVYRRYQLGLQFDRRLLRQMNKFGMPLVPAALALWAINFIDRWLIAILKDQAEVGVYSVAVRIASAVVFLLVAFRTAWPAFAYSIDDDHEARRAYSYVLTYVVYVTCWASLGLAVLAPWLVRLLARNPAFHRASEAVGLLAFSGAAYAGYIVLAIGSSRARKTQGNWIVAGTGAAINIGLNFILIPAYGMVGAAIATLVAYIGLFIGMFIYAQRVYPVSYQWRRVLTAAGAATVLAVVGSVLDLPLVVAILIALAYPLCLFPLRFYLPSEVARMRRLVALAR